MNVRGNILIIWQGWKPNLQTSTFWHTISLCLPALPPLYPLVSSSHLTPFVSQGPIKIPPPLPASPVYPPTPSSLKCHLHFSVHILRLELPVDGLIFLALTTATFTAHCGLSPASSLYLLMTDSRVLGGGAVVYVCVCVAVCVHERVWQHIVMTNTVSVFPNPLFLMRGSSQSKNCTLS